MTLAMIRVGTAGRNPKERIVDRLQRKMLFALTLLLAGSAATRLSAEENVEERACARLLPAIERLEAMLAREARDRSAVNEIQRIQVIATLLGFRYRSLESLESSLRDCDSAEADVRDAMARTQVQLDAIEEAARNSATPIPDQERKAQRADFEAVMRGLEERAKGIQERRATYQGQLAIERNDIQKLEGLVRAWLEKSP